MIVVAGGTGRLGSKIVSRLVTAGHPVRVLARGLTGTVPEGAELVRGDVRSSDDVARALEGAEVVVSAVQGFAGPGKVSPRTVDRQGNQRLIAGAARAGADVVLVSVTHASSESPLEIAREKYAAEQCLCEARVGWTVVRSAAFVELWVEILEKTAGRSHRPVVFGRGDRPLWWVSVGDVADVVTGVVLDRSARGSTIDVVGPAGLTLEELAQKVMAAHDWSGSPRHIPPAALLVGSVTVGALVPSIRRQLRAALAMDQLTPETSPSAEGRRSVDDVLAASAAT